MKPLINDDILRAELKKLEDQGVSPPISTQELVRPPTSARRETGYPSIAMDELERLRAVVRKHGLELINDGASYRVKRQRDFMIWTLATSPLVSEVRGGGEGYALIETVRRFCG